VAFVQSECLLKELSTFIADSEVLQNSIKKVKEDHRKVWQIILTQANQTHEVETPSFQTRNNQNMNFDGDILSKLPPIVAQELESLRESTRAVWAAMQENENLMAEFESLATGTGH